MHVICFCGTEWFSDEDLAYCPECGEPACTPNVTNDDLADMRRELALMLHQSQDG